MRGAAGAWDPQRNASGSKVRSIVSRSRPISSARTRQRSSSSTRPTSALLGLAGGERGDLHRARRGVWASRLEDFRPAGGEGAQVLVGKALDLGDALADWLPLDAEAAGQLVAQVGLVDVGGGFA